MKKKSVYKRLGDGSKKEKMEQDKNSEEEKEKDVNTGMTMSFKYPSLMYMGRMGSELCVVERPILSMLENLPMSFQKKTFKS